MALAHPRLRKSTELSFRVCVLRSRSRAAAAHPPNVPHRTSRGALQTLAPAPTSPSRHPSRNPIRTTISRPVKLASQIYPEFPSKYLPEIRSEVPEELTEGASKRCPSCPKRSRPDTCKSLSANKIFCTLRPALPQRQTIKGPFGNRRRPHDRQHVPSNFVQG